MGFQAYGNQLQVLAVLCHLLVEEAKLNVDFWIFVRTSDNAAFVEFMGIEKSKVLNCCAHLTPVTDYFGKPN